MNLRQRRCLRGPNVWAACPVFEVALELGDGAWPPEQIRQTLERLGAALVDTLPGTDPDGEPTLFRLAYAFGLAARKLQERAGNPVSFVAARPAALPGVFRVAVEFVEEAVGQKALETALQLLHAVRDGRTPSLEEDLRSLCELAEYWRLPVSTRAVYEAARARGIPAARLSPDYTRFLRLGQGAKQRRCVAAEPDSVSGVARLASTDKVLTKQLFQSVGVPTPEGRLVDSAEQAWAAASELGLPVAVKPQDMDLATGVSLDVRSREQVEAAYHHASQHGSEVLVERFAPGLEHRVLVVGDRVAAVSRIDPPHVIGDGVSTIAELVERFNRDPRRGPRGSGAPLGSIVIDEVVHAVLAAQGSSLASVPAAGQRVLLRRNPPYLDNGGTLSDLTDQIHPSVAAHAVAAAQAVQVSVAGLDVVAVDISKPLEEQGGVFVELNAGPGLWLHLAPWADSPRPVGEAIVASLFPAGSDGRIPIAALIDPAGGARTHLTALLSTAGWRVGSVAGPEITVGGRRWRVQAESPQERAGLLLQNTGVDVALLETSPRELVRAGFGSDRCDVAIVLEHTIEANGDALDPPVNDFLEAVKHALGPKGVLIIQADLESASLEMGQPLERVFRIAGQGQAVGWQKHVAAGGRGLAIQDGVISVAHGAATPMPLANVPEKIGERETASLLSALAAGLILGQTPEALRTYLASLNDRP